MHSLILFIAILCKSFSSLVRPSPLHLLLLCYILDTDAPNKCESREQNIESLIPLSPLFPSFPFSLSLPLLEVREISAVAQLCDLLRHSPREGEEVLRLAGGHPDPVGGRPRLVRARVVQPKLAAGHDHRAGGAHAARVPRLRVRRRRQHRLLVPPPLHPVRGGRRADAVDPLLALALVVHEEAAPLVGGEGQHPRPAHPRLVERPGGARGEHLPRLLPLEPALGGRHPDGAGSVRGLSAVVVHAQLVLPEAHHLRVRAAERVPLPLLAKVEQSSRVVVALDAGKVDAVLTQRQPRPPPQPLAHRPGPVVVLMGLVEVASVVKHPVHARASEGLDVVAVEHLNVPDADVAGVEHPPVLCVGGEDGAHVCAR
mmetsp:Transcript_33667/g.73498  ORF Transcript_33667/g.73498 Transcript_33667/m.73498 type:complete len:371 (-) Transcript_33667:604-1716(-)